MFCPDAEMGNDRVKLLMDRLVARRIRRDPELVVRAYDWLFNLREQSSVSKWWMDEWLNILQQGNDEVCRFISSRDQYARQMANCSPLYSKPAIGDMFHDLQLRGRLLKKARLGLTLLHERQTESDVTSSEGGDFRP